MATQDIDTIEIAKGGSQYDPIPENVYEVQITSIRKVEGTKWMSDEPEIKIEIEMTILNGEFSGRKLWRKVRPVLAQQPKESILYQLASAALGHKLSEEEIANFKLSGIQDMILKVSVLEVKKGDKVFNNIGSFMKIAKSEPTAPEIADEIPF